MKFTCDANRMRLNEHRDKNEILLRKNDENRKMSTAEKL